jgi:hypothetical protein
MADLNDVWNWPNNVGNGYATSSSDWSGNASFGIDKRVDDIRTYTYTAHKTGQLHYTNDLNRTTSSINTGFAAYKHYFDSHGDDTNPTFHQFAKYPCVEWKIQPNGRTIGGVHYELNANNMPQIRVQFTNAHEFANGDRIEFFGFDTDSSGATHRGLNMIKPYVGIVDGFNVVLYEDSGLTRLAQVPDAGFQAQTDVFFTALDDGSYNGALAHFDVFQETFSTGDVIQIADTFTNMGAGTLSSASSGTLVYLEKISGSNSYKLFSDSGRTTPFTLTGGQGVDIVENSPSSVFSGISFDIASNGSTVAITRDISSAGFNTVRAGIKAQNMTPESFSENTSNIYRGFCRAELTLGSGVSKAIPAYDVSGINKSAYFGYKYNDTTGIIEILTDPTISGRDSSPLTATNATGNVVGQVQIIDFWTYRNESTGTYDNSAQYFDGDKLPASGTNVGGLFFTGQVNDTSLNPVSPLSHPLASEEGTLYSSTKADGGDDNLNFHILIYQLAETTTRSTGTIQYQYQNSSNATVNGAEYDFTKFWRPGATSAFTPTYITTPTATPNLSTQGYINGSSDLAGFPNLGLFTLAGLGIQDGVNVHNVPILTGSQVDPPSAGKPSSMIIEKIGVFPINAKADEYVAPAAYAPDVFDTDDEWDTDAFDNRKNWPTHITPNGINITQNIPSSTTLSQNGTKYVRSSGVIKHQLEVSYPPMTYDDFREFEAVHQAARGQATPFYFIIAQQSNGLSTNLIWHRTDTANSNLNTAQLRIRQDITAGTKTFLVEGFRASDTDCFIRGECLIVPSNSSNNGSIRHVINDNVTSNKYGEAKIRLAVGMNNETAGRSIYKNPFHLRVTMAEDALEYEVGTDKLYRLTCRFDLDEFK